jgi:hypothetical protein
LRRFVWQRRFIAREWENVCLATALHCKREGERENVKWEQDGGKFCGVFDTEAKKTAQLPFPGKETLCVFKKFVSPKKIARPTCF